MPSPGHALTSLHGLLAAFAGAVLLATAPATAGPITPDPSDPKWLLHDGQPFFLAGPGDPEDFFHRGTQNPDGTRNGDQDAIVQKLIGTGANCLWMTAVRSHGGDGGATENPFVNGNPAQGVNATVLDQWEGWIAQLDAAEINTWFVFYDDSARPWNTGDTVSPAESTFFAEVVNRFEHHDHVIWCVAEEYDEAYTIPRIAQLGALIAQEDDGNHPIACHQLTSSSFDFAGDPTFHSFGMHTGQGHTPSSLHSMVKTAWNNAAGGYNVIMAEMRQHYTDRLSARRLSWGAAMAGGYVMVHAMDVANTPVEALEDCGRIVEFFESVPFHQMSHRDDLAFAGTQYVFGNPAAGYLLYAESLGGNLGLTVPPGAGGLFDFTWLDPETGLTVSQSGVTVPEGSHSWTTPPGLGADVALSLLPATATGVESSVAWESWGRVKAAFGSP